MRNGDMHVYLISILMFGFALPCFSQPNKLRETTVAPDLKLKMNSERVEFVGVTENTLPPSISLDKHDQIIATENPSLIAISGYDKGKSNPLGYNKKSGYFLRLFSRDGRLLSRFPIASLNIFIPKSKDVVWVEGRSQFDGIFLDLPIVTSMGLKVYNTSGRVIKNWAKDKFQMKRFLREVGDGTVYVMADIAPNGSGIYKMSTTGEIIKRIPWNGVGASDANVFNDGNFFVIETPIPARREYKTRLFNENGVVIAEYNYDPMSTVKILAMTRDAKYFVLARNSIDRNKRTVEVYSLKDIKSPVKTIHLDSIPHTVVVDNALQRFALDRNLQPANPNEQIFQVLDSSGTILAEYKCPQRREKTMVEMNADQKNIELHCGDQKVHLKFK